MESLWRHILKSIFDEFVTGLDDNIDCSKSMVELWDLKLKSEKIHEMYGDCLTSPVEFSDGVIGSMQMKMSWLGKIEISATNVVLNLNFTPFKAMKNVLMPGDELKEGFVHRVPDDLRRPDHWRGLFGGTGTLAVPPPVLPRYCSVHTRRTRRKKCEARDTQCTRCKVRLLTNYLECSLCIPCSVRENQCLLCSASLPAVAHPDYGKSEGFVFTVAEMRHPDYMSHIQTGSPPPYQVPPRFCKFHQRPDRQKIGEVRNGQCGHCQARLQSNYEEVALCAPCSSKESKCMLCGAYMPPAGSPLGLALPTHMVERLEQLMKDEATGQAQAHFADRSSAEWQRGLEVQHRNLMSDPLPLRRGASEPDSQQELERLSQNHSKDSDEDGLNTPDSTPRKQGGLKTPSPRSPLKGRHDDDEDVPMEDTLPAHRKTNQEGGATKPKAPQHSHWRHRWQHHHQHSENDFDHMLVPPPPPEPEAKEERRTSTSSQQSNSKNGQKGFVKSASSSVAHAAGKIGGIFGFGHHSSHTSDDKSKTKNPATNEEEVATPKSSIDGDHSKDGPMFGSQSSEEHRKEHRNAG